MLCVKNEFTFFHPFGVFMRHVSVKEAIDESIVNNWVSPSSPLDPSDAVPDANLLYFDQNVLRWKIFRWKISKKKIPSTNFTLFLFFFFLFFHAGYGTPDLQ